MWVAVISLCPSWKRECYTKGPLHIPGHVLILGISALIACRSAQSLSRRVVRFMVVTSFGCALEALQSVIFGGRFEWDDIVTDASGVLLAFKFTTFAFTM